MEMLLAVVAIIAFIAYINSSQKSREKARDVVLETIAHVPSLLRDQTGMGPWYELDYLFRKLRVDVKCESCEIDRTWACNSTGETYYADLHYSDGRTRVMFGDRCVFDGNAMNLLRFPIVDQAIRPDQLANMPPKGTWAYSSYNEWLRSQHASADTDILGIISSPSRD